MSIKNFSLTGIGKNVQFGKNGGRIVENSENFTLRNQNNNANANLTLARGLFDSGSVTDPAMSFSADSNTGFWNNAADAIQIVTNGAARVTVVDPGTANAVVTFEGGSAIRVPSGNTAARPSSPINGMVRYNSSDNLFEGYENGAWVRFSNVNVFADNLFRIFNNGDNTRLLAFEVSGVSTATTRTVTMVDRNITLDTVTMGSTDTNATAGSILFSTGTKLQQNNANLFWDNTNNRLGVGTNTPATALTVAGVISSASSAAGEVRWYEPSGGGSDYVAFRAPALTATTTYILPSSDGTNGQALVTNGSGTLSWQTVSTPGALRTLRVAINESTSGDNNLGSPLPSGARVVRIRVQIITAWTGTVSIGSTGNPGELMTVAEIDEQFIGFSEKNIDGGHTNNQLIYTNSGTGTGVGVVFVEYIV